MVIRWSLVLAVALLSQSQLAISQKAYAWFTNDGKEIDFDQVIKRSSKTDVLLFGELHNNSVCHWMQLELLMALHEKGEEMQFGAEMLEADDQSILNEYQTGLITAKLFEREARLWPNYNTDYKPLVDFSVENNIQIVATNVPRRYASVVAKKGQTALQSFTDESQEWMAPLPYPFSMSTPGYQEMLDMMGGHGSGHGSTSENMVQAQAIKDATMAHFILDNWKRGKLFYHIQGDFHSANWGGIAAYIKEYNAKRDVLVISTVESESVEWDEGLAGRADIILLVKQNFTKTH